MNKIVSFHELAELELNDAAIFFENETEGLGSRFLATVETAVAEIRQHPHASAIILRDVRRKVVRKFPYHILFQHPARSPSHSRDCKSKTQALLLARSKVNSRH